jgi:hypothetical protein
MRELTPEEQAKLEALSGDGTKVKFSWDDTFQRRIDGDVVDRPGHAHAEHGQNRPGYFSNEVHVMACKILFEYFT